MMPLGHGTSCVMAGYSIVLKPVINCRWGPVLTVSSPTATLYENCTLVLSGCLLTKPHKYNYISYNLKSPNMGILSSYFNPLLLKGVTNGCKIMTIMPPDYLALTPYSQTSVLCPITVAGSTCFGAYDLTSLADLTSGLALFSALGPIEATLDMVHGGGKTTCLKVNAQLKKSNDPLNPSPVVPDISAAATSLGAFLQVLKALY